MKFWTKEAGFLMPGAGCHLSHCLADLLDSQTRCILLWRKEAGRSDGLNQVHVRHSQILSIYRSIRGGFRKCIRNISVHITFKLMRLFHGLFA